MTAYYNEVDPYAAQWLRNLIAAGHIAPGEVDERSIADVRPDDLAGYRQCHFFAGIGVWSYALRLAGWPDDRPVWTGSCPCQPFSAAGKQSGMSDERHLWPVWFKLIRQCQPDVVFGEQVESAIRHGWLDLVQSDMEGSGYAFGAVGIPAAGFGAPHIRQRLWFVADTLPARRPEWRPESGRGQAPGGGVVGELADNPRERCGEARERCGEARERCGEARECGGRPEEWAGDGGESGLMGDAERAGLEGLAGHGDGGRGPVPPRSTSAAGESGGTGPTNGHWRDADWIFCRDGKWRPVEPGTFPLAHGAPARVGRLRGYGNAVAAPVAAEFIGAYLDV